MKGRRAEYQECYNNGADCVHVVGKGKQIRDYFCVHKLIASLRTLTVVSQARESKQIGAPSNVPAGTFVFPSWPANLCEGFGNLFGGDGLLVKRLLVKFISSML